MHGVLDRPTRARRPSRASSKLSASPQGVPVAVGEVRARRPRAPAARGRGGCRRRRGHAEPGAWAASTSRAQALRAAVGDVRGATGRRRRSPSCARPGNSATGISSIAVTPSSAQLGQARGSAAVEGALGRERADVQLVDDELAPVEAGASPRRSTRTRPGRRPATGRARPRAAQREHGSGTRRRRRADSGSRRRGRVGTRASKTPAPGRRGRASPGAPTLDARPRARAAPRPGTVRAAARRVAPSGAPRAAGRPRSLVRREPDDAERRQRQLRGVRLAVPRTRLGPTPPQVPTSAPP